MFFTSEFGVGCTSDKDLFWIESVFVDFLIKKKPAVAKPITISTRTRTIINFLVGKFFRGGLGGIEFCGTFTGKNCGGCGSVSWGFIPTGCGDGGRVEGC